MHPFAWLTEKVCPPMTMLALRVGPVLAATVKLIVVVPVPFAGTPVIHAGTPLLVQTHAAAVFTANELDPPDAGRVVARRIQRIAAPPRPARP